MTTTRQSKLALGQLVFLMVVITLLGLPSGSHAFMTPSSISSGHSVAVRSNAFLDSRRGGPSASFSSSSFSSSNPSVTSLCMAMEQAGGEQSSHNWIRRGARKCRGVMSKTKMAIHNILQWQKKQGKSMVTAAVLTLAVLFGSSTEAIDSYVQPHTEAVPVHTLNRFQQQQQVSTSASSSSSPMTTAASTAIARGGGGKVKAKKFWEVPAVGEAYENTARTLSDAIQDLTGFMEGAKADTLLLLLATSLITPLCRKFGLSPILGFLSAGMLMGPNGFGLISGIHTTETLAELGIVFFLFEMGIELSFDRLMSMKKDVFGLGMSQFGVTALAIASVGKLMGLPANALVVLGGGLALSSSAFVLQLLKDKDQLATRFGKASFGVLLFQDLAVVPLLVVTPILAGTGPGLAQALTSATLKATIALGAIAAAGRYLLNPLFKTVAEARSQEAFLGVVLLTVLSMSFMTEGLGLSNTLGAFLAGVLLSETKYRYQVEADIAPFRGILLGLFFVTVGFEIDLGLIASKLPQVMSIVLGIMGIKAAIATALSLGFGLSLATAQQTGLILSQGGEFAFVAFGLARSLGILDQPTTKLLLTCVSLTMALTPAANALGAKLAKKMEEGSDFTHYMGQDSDAIEIKESDDFAVVVGYGAVGKVVCDLLDRKLIRYVGLEVDPNKAIQARNKGLPVFYGDVSRPEVADAFGVGKAKCVILCIADKQQANRAAIAIRRMYPEIQIFSRAKDADHAKRLQDTLDVVAMVPVLPEDNVLMTLPFGGAVLKSLGTEEEEVNAILEAKRKEVLQGSGLRDTEREASLLQLGIKVEDEEEPLMQPYVDVADEDEDEMEQAELEAAAAEAVKETKTKSPKVASAIEANFPGATSEDDEPSAENEEPTE